MTCRARVLAITFAFSALTGAWGQFYAVMPAPNCTESKVTGLSAGGRTASGWSWDTHSYQPGFSWTPGGGLSNFGGLPGMSIQTTGMGLSGDGSTAVGLQKESAGGIGRAYRYRQDLGLQTLGTIGNFSISEAHGANNDASVIVGSAHDSSYFSSTAWRWTESGGMQSLGYTRPSHFYSDATAISRDGSAIVGYSLGGSTTDAFIWTESGGMTALHGIDGRNAHAYGVNGTGSIVVGNSKFGGTLNHAVLWRDAGILDLGVTPDMARSFATAVSDDGSIVVGYAEMLTSFNDQACIWTQSTGMMTLGDYLAASGVSTPAGWIYEGASAISADGRTIAGYGSFGDGHITGFVVTIPAPASAIAVLATLPLSGLRPRRRRSP
ncbi:MAG: hypothetical protein AABZ53_00110 [Planctomycetota bacterium]